MGTIFFYPPDADTPLLLSIDAQKGTSGNSIKTAIEEFIGLDQSACFVFVTRNQSIETLTWGDHLLRTGCVITARPSIKYRPDELTLFELEALSGPDTGQRFTLSRGKHLLGKNNLQVSICLADDSIRDIEGQVEVKADGINWKQSGGSAQDIKMGVPFSIGNSTLILRQNSSNTAPSKGFLDFEPIDIDLPVPRKKWVQFLTVLMPLIVGVSIALITRSWLFLLMSLASSLMIGIHTISSSGESKKFRKALENYVQQEYKRMSSIPGLSDLAEGAKISSSSAIIFLGRGQKLSSVSHRNLAEDRRPVLEEVPIYLSCQQGLAYELDLPVDKIRAIFLGLLAQEIHIQVTPDEYALEIEELLKEIMVHPSINENAFKDSKTRVRIISPEAFESTNLTEISNEEILFVLGKIRHSASENIRLSATGNYNEKLIISDFLREKYGLIDCWLDGVSRQTFIKGVSNQMLLSSEESGKRVEVKPTHLDKAFSLPKRSWLRHATYAPDLQVLIGFCAQEEVYASLTADGPHWLIGGTTGSGKSQLLRTMLLSVALRYPASRVAFCLIDFKGGATLGALAQLPQTVSLLTDLQPSAVERALDFLMVDLRLREEEFQRVNVTSYQEYLALHWRDQTIPLFPELVIAIDEFKILIDQMPHAMDRLMKVATIGRSLGIHLILATQRPQGAVSQDIRANIALTICLRVASAQDSFNLLGNNLASEISGSTPGFGYLATAGETPLAFQAPLFTGFHDQNEELQIRHSDKNDLREYSAPQSEEDFVRSVATIAGSSLRETVYQPIPKELPALLSIDSVAFPPDKYLVGLSESSKISRQEYVYWSPASDGSIAILAEPTMRLNYLSAFIEQSKSMNIDTVLITADNLLLRSLRDNTNYTALSAVIGLDDPDFLEAAIDRLLMESDASPVLVIIDALELMSELLVRHPMLENKIHLLIREGHRNQCQIIATSSQPLRGRAANNFSSIIWSASVVSQDPIKMSSKEFPDIDFEEFALEGTILNSTYQHQVIAAKLTPLYSDFSQAMSNHYPSVARFEQLPTDISLGAVSDKPADLKGTTFYMGNKFGQCLSFAPAQGKIIPVLGTPLSGKSNFLQVLRRMNPEWSYLLFSGKSTNSVGQLHNALAKITDPKRTVILIDDAMYLPGAIQEEVIKLAANYRAIFTVFASATGIHQSPILRGLQGCSYGIVLKPEKQHLDLFISAALPYDLKTQGHLYPGRAIMITPQSTTAFQIPLSK